MNIKTIINNQKTHGILAIIAAIVMYFTPDYIDKIIELGLSLFGIQKLVLKKED
jgi:hypothetical protein